jgi:hypothetical protein
MMTGFIVEIVIIPFYIGLIPFEPRFCPKSNMPQPEYIRNVFINCPFDEDYKPLFYALIFAVHDCGFLSRCALELLDSGAVRIDKICGVIQECQYGIHDISRTELSTVHQLPRFNMPLELGLFLGAKRFGQGEQSNKQCLILDQDPYRYQKFCSDIAGQDIQVHHQLPADAIKVVRNWLAASLPNDVILPGGAKIVERYEDFCEDLPIICVELGLTIEDLIFSDFRRLVFRWLNQNQW